MVAIISYGQELPDTLRPVVNRPDLLDPSLQRNDLLELLPDTLPQNDSLLRAPLVAADSLAADSLRPARIEAPIVYNAEDSIVVSFDGQRVFMYKNAKVTYQQIELVADYIELNLETKEIYAEGRPDSTGTLVGQPVFKDGNEEFESKSLRYNFETEKGIITDVVTKQGEGFVHSTRTKKISKDAFILQRGKYTTCDADHPHFYLHLSKAKVISNKKIITGPAYMVLEDFPLYFPVIPFGYFPNSPSYSSGILVPSYGEEGNRGFFLREGGYYWAANEYFDAAVRGDIYSRGSWAAKFHTNYRVRYKFSGGFDFRYALNVYGEKGLDTYNRSPQFQIMWSHSQDPKANPNRTFSANVNFSTSGYDKQNSLSAQNYLRTQKSSSVSYTKRWENTPFSMSANLRHSQNSIDSTLTLTLPELTFNVARFYPLKSKAGSGVPKWYEKFGFTYSANMRNSITAKEKEIMHKSLTKDWQNGIRHNIPISLPNFNLFTYINVSPGFSYNESWYFTSIKKSYHPDEWFIDRFGRQTHVRIDTLSGLKRDYSYSYSLSTSTNIYGSFMPLNPNSRVKGIRHKITPSLSFSYRPDFGQSKFGMWDRVQVDSTGRMEYYSYVENGIYGYTGRGSSGAISLSVSNNLEMKVLDTKDTTGTAKYKKVKLIDNLSFSTSYNLIADSLNLSPISIQGRTTIKGISINFGTNINPYMTDRKGMIINQYVWNHRKGLAKIGRLDRANLSFGLQFQSKKGEGQAQATQEAIEEDKVLPGDYADYVDFNIPWNISLDYSFNYSRPNPYVKATFFQTIGVNGSMSLTDKWRLTMNTNYDIMARKFAFTNFSVFRDMHCWEMSFNFVPFGYMKSYSFTLNARSSMLKDLKVTKQRSHYDNF